MTTKQFALRSRSKFAPTDQRFIRAVDGGKLGEALELRADRTAVGPDEVFTATIDDDGAIRELRTRTGVCVSVDASGTLVGRKEGELAHGQPWQGPGGDERLVPTRPLLRRPGGGGAVGGGSATLDGRLVVDGRMFRNKAGLFRPVLASALTALAPNKPVAPFFDWCRAMGFNGVRIFGGALSWAGQTAESARALLPLTLAMAADRGLYVELVLHTDTGAQPYDKALHNREVLAIVRGMSHLLIEGANEFEHATQDSQVHDPEWLKRALAPFMEAGFACAIGAPDEDEPDQSGKWKGVGASYGTAHLDRGRDKWNQCRRVREIEACSAAGRFPVLNNEPIGAAEPGTPGQRRNDPDFFYTLGVLNRLFEVGGVFHFQDGLHCNPDVGPVQTACAQAFVKASHLFDAVPERLTYLNVGHAGSPIEDANFSNVVRAYSGVAGGRGISVLVGLTGDAGLKFGNGWAPTGTLDENGGCRVLSIKQGA